jgi:hypothetical protein
MKHRAFVALVAPLVAAIALLFAVSPASAHEIVVVCDEESGDLVWSNVLTDTTPATVELSNGTTIEVPAGATVTTPHPGPGTWVATFGSGEVTEGVIPPSCREVTTTLAPTTIAGAMPTAPPLTGPVTTGPAINAPATSEAATQVAPNTLAAPATTGAGSDTLPVTGSGRSLAAIAGMFLVAGVLVTMVARRGARA